MLLPTIDNYTLGLIFSSALAGFAVMWSVKKAIMLIHR